MRGLTSNVRNGKSSERRKKRAQCDASFEMLCGIEVRDCRLRGEVVMMVIAILLLLLRPPLALR